ncbi:MAG: ribosomal protein S18-alanine N-acetyltransferase [Caulobacteraceae bacterium]|nr:ribosomal protein S18-alanine N-acetyltransferase [Caulobacteraceae bacterium]
MILRLATGEDAEALAEIHAGGFDRPWTASEFESLLSSPGVFAMLARSGAAVAGFVLCRIAADEAEVLTLVTAPALRRRGVAAALLEAATGVARARGAATLFLEVAEDNLAARALYAAAGWGRVGRRRAYYARGDGSMAALALRRDLNR